MDANKFLLMGNGPIVNRGCEAIVLGIGKIIEREFGPSRFLLASFAQDRQEDLPGNIMPIALDFKRPRWSRAWWRYQASKIGLTREEISSFVKPLHGRLEGIMAAFSIGGDGYSIDWGHYIVDRLIYMDKYVKSLGIPAIIWGASIGPFTQEPQFETEMKDHFKTLDLIIVREPHSLSYLRELGVEENVCMHPDPAFVLNAAPCDLGGELAQVLQAPCLGVNLSMLLAKYVTVGDVGKWEELAVSMVRALLHDTGMPLIMIPHVFGVRISEKMDDKVFMKRIRERLKAHERKRVWVIEGEMNSENLKWVIGKLEALVSMRMHAAIAALTSYIPCLSIAYSRKAWGLYEMVFSKAEWVIDARTLSPSMLSAQTIAMLDKKERIIDSLERNIPSLQESALSAAKRIRSTLSEKGWQGGKLEEH